MTITVIYPSAAELNPWLQLRTLALRQVLKSKIQECSLMDFKPNSDTRVILADISIRESVLERFPNLHSAPSLTPWILTLLPPAPKFLSRTDRTVFAPALSLSAIGNLSPEKLATIAEINAWLSDAERTLLAVEPNELSREMNPGLSTLISPKQPSMYLNALANASQVLSFSQDPVIYALSHHIPAFLINFSPIATHRLSLPTISITSETDAASFRSHLFEAREHFPWDRLKPILEQGRDSAQSWVDSLSQPLPAQGTEHSETKTPTVMHFLSVSDSQYLGQLVGWIENISQFKNIRPHFHLLDLDGRTTRTLLNLFENTTFSNYQLSDLWSPEELKEIETRSPGLKAFSSKPRLLLNVLNQTQAPTFYFDSDVFFYESPQTLLSEIQDSAMLLFPHWNDHFPQARMDGLFNAGMIGVNRGAEPFLKWWSEQCLERCVMSCHEGVVGDQAYLDFAPIYCTTTQIYRRADHNVARWNLLSLGVHLESHSPERPQLQDGRSIKSYHAAFRDSLGCYETKFAWDQLASFFTPPVLSIDSGITYANTLELQAPYWRSLSRTLRLRDLFHRLHLGQIAASPQSVARWMKISEYDFGIVLARFAQCLASLRRKPTDITQNIQNSPSWVDKQSHFLMESIWNKT